MIVPSVPVVFAEVLVTIIGFSFNDGVTSLFVLLLLAGQLMKNLACVRIAVLGSPFSLDQLLQASVSMAN